MDGFQIFMLLIFFGIWVVWALAVGKKEVLDTILFIGVIVVGSLVIGLVVFFFIYLFKGIGSLFS